MSEVEKLAAYLYDTICGSECHGAGGWGQTYKDDASNEDKQDYRRYARNIITILKSFGYLPVEEAHLEVLGDEEIRKAVNELYEAAIYAHKHQYSITDGRQQVTEKAIKWFSSAIAYNEKQGKLYRVRK